MVKVSAVIPAFNTEKYIRNAVMSLVNQKIKLDEIIIIDDGSTDNTLKVINLLANQYKNIRVIEQSSNQGVSVARNLGIQEATSEWILFLDADDECSEQLLDTYLNKMRTDSFESIYSGYYQIDESSKVVSDSITGKSLISTEGFCKVLIRNPIVSPSGLLIKRKVLFELKGFDTSMKMNEDVDLWLRILDSGYQINHVESPLTFIRRHRNNTTSNMEKSHNAEKIILNKYNLIYIEEKFKSLDSTTHQNKLDLVTLLIRYDKWEDAKRLLDSISISITNTSYVSYLFLKSLYYIFVKEHNEVEKVIQEILTVSPDHGASLNNLGVIYVSKNEFELAKEYFNKALHLHSNYIDARKNLNLLNSGLYTIEEYSFTKRELRKVLLSYSE